MAWLEIILLSFLSTWIRKITQFIVSGSILFLPPYKRGEKNIWSELELNPGPLASLATTLTHKTMAPRASVSKSYHLKKALLSLPAWQLLLLTTSHSHLPKLSRDFPRT